MGRQLRTELQEAEPAMKRNEVRVTLSPQAMTMLERLARAGLYGRGVAGVARGFIYAGLRQFTVEEKLKVGTRNGR